MRSVQATLCVLIAMMAAPHGVAAPAPSISAAEYTLQLQQLRQSLVPEPQPEQAEKLASGLPDQWTIDSQGKTFTVSSAAIVADLQEYARKPASGALTAAREEVDLRLADALAMSDPQIDAGNENARLAEILSRREFQRVHGETWLDRIKRQLRELLERWFGRLLTSSAFPVASRIIVWTLVALAVGLLALWLVRAYRESNIYTNISGIPGAVSEKPWRDWRAEAQAAADGGRWRDAVHLYYWAAISFLEGQGLWRPDRARTPREYLRLLRREDPHRAPLTELTRSFETVWYGDQAANEQSVVATKALLENLGCR